MMKALIEELRVALNDIDGLGYSDELLAEYINDALCQLVKLKPERFTKPVIIKANRGQLQCLPSCYRSLVSVIGVVDKCGNPLNAVSKGNTALAKAFNKKPMADIETTYTFSMVEGSSKTFEVYPAIKPSDDVYFSIMAVIPPSNLDLDDEYVNCEFHEEVIHYALYRAYYQETESQTSIAMGDRHIKMFYQLLGLERKLDKENDKYKRNSK